MTNLQFAIARRLGQLLDKLDRKGSTLTAADDDEAAFLDPIVERYREEEEAMYRPQVQTAGGGR